jgi:uncharacterized protein (TIGR02284 family)
MGTATTNQATIEQLNSFLRGEMSAVETYSQAIEKMSDEPSLRAPLSECQRSHEQRVQILMEEIRRFGGTPEKSSGAWGSFAKLVEGGSKVFGKKAALAALEEGEDHGRNDYQRDLDDLSPEARRLVETKLLPEQLKTHDRLNQIKSMA